jgi:hypothetical protein
MLNNGGPRYKRSKLEKKINTEVVWCVIILFILCLIGAIGTGASILCLIGAIGTGASILCLIGAIGTGASILCLIGAIGTGAGESEYDRSEHSVTDTLYPPLACLLTVKGINLKYLLNCLN